MRRKGITSSQKRFIIFLIFSFIVLVLVACNLKIQKTGMADEDDEAPSPTPSKECKNPTYEPPEETVEDGGSCGSGRCTGTLKITTTRFFKVCEDGRRIEYADPVVKKECSCGSGDVCYNCIQNGESCDTHNLDGKECRVGISQGHCKDGECVEDCRNRRYRYERSTRTAGPCGSPPCEGTIRIDTVKSYLQCDGKPDELINTQHTSTCVVPEGTYGVCWRCACDSTPGESSTVTCRVQNNDGWSCEINGQEGHCHRATCVPDEV